MATAFTVVSNQFPSNVVPATTATAIAAWLNGLSITVTTNYTFSIVHKNGFWVVMVIYA